MRLKNKSIREFILEQTKNGSCYFKIYIDSKNHKYTYTKYFRIDKDLKILTYEILNGDGDYNMGRRFNQLHKDEMALSTLISNYGCYYNGNRVISVEQREFDMLLPKRFKK